MSRIEGGIAYGRRMGVSTQDKVMVFDTTLRDGEQSPGAALNIDEKLEIAHALGGDGRRRHRGWLSHLLAGRLSGGAAHLAGDPRLHHLRPDTGQSEGHRRGRRGAASDAARPRIHTGLGVSDVHIQHKLRTTREGALEMGVEAVKHAKKFVDDVQYYTEDAGRADPEYLYRVLEAVIDAGATVVNIPDTTGYTTPDEFGALIRGILDNVPNIDKAIVSVHCHNDLGMATANTLAGVRNGARQVEVTVNGIGERAGNTSLEEVVMALQTRRDLFGLETGIDTRRIYPVSRLVSQLTGIPVQPNKAIVGAQCLCPLVRHPPGRRAEGAHHLRDHQSPRRGRARFGDRALGAVGAGRAAPPPGRTGLHAGRGAVRKGLRALPGGGRQEKDGGYPRPGGHRRRRGADCSSRRPTTWSTSRSPAATTASPRPRSASGDRTGRSTAMPTTAPARWMPSTGPSTASSASRTS